MKLGRLLIFLLIDIICESIATCCVSVLNFIEFLPKNRLLCGMLDFVEFELPFLIELIIFLSYEAVGLCYSLIDNVLRIILVSDWFFKGFIYAVFFFAKSLKYRSGSSVLQTANPPVNISSKIMPNDQTSLFSLYIFSLYDSGDM